MGFYSYAYVIEGSRTDSGIELAISGYSMAGPTLFSWGRGSRPDGMETLAAGTLYCEQHTYPLAGYPRIDRRDADDDEALFLIEESFSARSNEEPVLFHVALPPRFVIRPDKSPFTLTKDASITALDDRLVFTLPTVGGADMRFWIARMRPEETFDDYDLNRLLTAPDDDPLKIGFELNFGIAKLKIGT